MIDLHPDHLADLKKSGLSDKTIIEADIKSVPPDMINKVLGFNIPGIISMYAIPYGNGYYRFKIFYDEQKI